MHLKSSLSLVTLLLVPQAAMAGFRVSSFKKETRLGDNTWNVASALDGKSETAWMIDPEESNVGSWIEIDVPKSKIDGLGVVVGWDVDEDRFKDYARIKTLKVEVLTEEGERKLEHSVSFKDERGWQLIDLPDTEVGDEFSGGTVRLTVSEVYDGKDYPNLAVSDVLVRLAEMEAPVKLESAPQSALEGHPADALVDGSDRTYWASEGSGDGQSFVVGASGWGVSSVGIQAGPKDVARPKTVEVTASNTTMTHTLSNTSDVQWVSVPAVLGYTGSAWSDITVKIVDTYAQGDEGGTVGISEVMLKATSYDGL